MTRTIHGVIHGRTIELREDPEIADGQQVEIIIKTVPAARLWGEGLRRCAGAFAAEWTEEDDRIMEQIHQDRKRSRVEGDKRIEGAGVRSGSCRVGSFARDGFGVVGPKRAVFKRSDAQRGQSEIRPVRVSRAGSGRGGAQSVVRCAVPSGQLVPHG